MSLNIRQVDEATITKIIIKKTAQDWLNLAETDAIVVGAGPSGLTAATYLAKSGLKTVVFERKLSFGGGIGGGGMQFHKVVVESPAERILKEIGCPFEQVEQGLFTVDTSTLMAKLANSAVDAGAKIIFGVTVEDVIFRGGGLSPPKVVGVVIQWTSVIASKIHVDPLGVKAKAVIDCTGHDAEVISVATRKIPLYTLVKGEKAMWASEGEKLTVEKTGEVCPGLYVAGMAVATLHQTPRMGPIFGGMLLSGKKVADLIIGKLGKREPSN